MPDPSLTPVVFFGTLRDAALRQSVLGEVIPTTRATLSDAEVRHAEGGDWPVLTPCAGQTAEGELAWLGPGALERADYYEGLFGYRRRAMQTGTSERTVDAQVYVPERSTGGGTAAWVLADWQADHGPLARLAAGDVMALMGVRDPAETARRWPMIRARAQARLNARVSGPTDLRRATQPGDIDIHDTRLPYAAFFSVEEYDLTHVRFEGGRSARMTRAAFVSADAVTVLPYDPVRDHVLLIEQFRAGPLARGDAQCWLLEAIAGRIDPGETPEAAAFREAREEAHLRIERLIPIASYYPTPGAKSEYLYSFLGVAELPAEAAGLGGVADEHEDIRAHVVPFDRLADLVKTGEIDNAPLLLSVMALQAQREGLRHKAQGPRLSR